MGNTAYLNINVRVASAQAMAALKQLNTATRGIGSAGGAAAGGLKPFNLAMKASNLEKFGKNLQWTGRQLQYNFTLPIVLAGYAVGKWAMANERAMTRVRAVYGSATDDAGMLKKETDALGKSFDLLSSRFGVHQDQVINIGQAWAEAGVAGRGLAEATKLTLEVMTITGMEQEKAVTGLMAIQAAYKLNTTQLRDQIAVLAGINKTGTITFAGLIEVVQRAGGAARAAGIDIQHLAAMANVLTPAAGSASQAGNALRTMISRLQAPTKDTVEIMGLMGINVKEASWQAKDGNQKFAILSKTFAGLSTSQKNLVASVIASRWQINRFDILMEDMNSQTGAWAKALRETNDPAKNLAIYARMLTTELSSTPKGLEILTNTMKNSLTRAFLPMMPALLGILAHITKLFVWFSRLDPRVQQLAFGFLLVLAVIGPIVKYMGALNTLWSIGLRVLNLFVVGLSREAAASAIAEGAEAEHAGSLHGLTIAAAYARVAIGQFVASLWLIGTFPFRAVAMAMGLIWRATIEGTKLAIQGVFGFVRYLLQLPIVQRAVAAITAPITAAIQLAWTAAGYGILVAWEAVGTALEALPTVIGLAWIAVSEAIATAWTILPTAIGLAWMALPQFFSDMVTLWDTLPAIAGIIGQGLQMVWLRVTTALTFIWEGFVEAAITLWYSLPLAGEKIAEVMIAVWSRLGLMLHGVWLAVLDAMEVAWTAIGVFMLEAWDAVVAAMSFIWTAGGVLLLEAWAAIQSALEAAWALIPTIWEAMVGAMETIWIGGMYVMEAATEGLMAFLMALPGIIAGIADGMVAALASPWLLVGLAVGAFVVLFRKQIGQAVHWVIEQFNRLPLGIGGALTAVANMLARWAKAVSNWLSYLNPFAHHSPSLVENVTAGIDAIARQYSRLANIGTVFRRAITDLAAFNQAIAGIVNAAQEADRNELRKNAGSALPQLEQIWRDEDALRVVLGQVSDQYQQQAQTVDQLKVQLDALDASLDAEKVKLNQLEAAADSAKKSLDAAKDTLSDLASYQITGMRAAEDAIFANEMAQKQLQLQILQMEDAAGGSIDDLRNKIAKLNGDMELLTGQREDLRQAGAGSEILQTYDDQIKAIQDQQNALQDLVQPIDDAKKALEELQRQGQILDLQKSINFDSQMRQIDQMVNGLKEMPFDQLYGKIVQQKQLVDQLQGSYDGINQQVDTQRDKVDALQQQRDALAATYDLEKNKLDAISDAYDAINDKISQMDDAVQQLASSTDKLKQAAGDSSLNQDIFNAGAGQNFDIPGGTSTLGREGGLEDINKFNDEMQKQLDDALGGLGKIDLFKPLKDMWNSAWGWIKKTVGPIVGPIWDKVKEQFNKGINSITGGGGLGSLFTNFKDKVQQGDWKGALSPITDAWDSLGKQLEDTPLNSAFDNITNALETFGDTVSGVWSVVSDTLLPGLKDMGGWFMDAGRTIGGELKKWGGLFDPFVEATGHIWAVTSKFLALMEDIFKVVVGAILAVWTFVWPILLNVLRPIFDGIIGLIKAALEIVRGVILFVLALINGDWGQAWDAIKAILAGVWDAIFTIVKTTFGVIYGFLKGAIEGIIDLFRFIWDHALGPIMQGLWDNIKKVWDGIGNAIVAGINLGIDAINLLIAGLNLVAKILPGIDFHIDPLKKLTTGGSGGGSTPLKPPSGGGFYAAGGRLPAGPVGAGFVTNGPRAIVGEGNRLYPEFVIPTDPRYRGRATGLLRAATASLGGNATGLATAAGNHHDEVGGFGLHTITDPLSDLLGAFRKGAAIAAFAGPLAAANVIIDHIPWKFVREAADSFKNKLYNWVKGEDDKAAGDAAAAAAKSSTISGTGWKAIDNWLNTNSTVPHRITSTLRVGDPGYHGAGRAVDYAGPHASWNSPELLAINQALLPIASKLAELIYAGPGGKSYKDGVPHTYSTSVQEDHHDHVHAALAAGGRLLFARRTGGTLLRLGEGRSNEEIQVKPLRNNSTDGETHNHFYGDLTFPNVKDGDDAEAFIRNLESLV